VPSSGAGIAARARLGDGYRVSCHAFSRLHHNPRRSVKTQNLQTGPLRLSPGCALALSLFLCMSPALGGKQGIQKFQTWNTGSRYLVRYLDPAKIWQTCSRQRLLDNFTDTLCLSDEDEGDMFHDVFVHKSGLGRVQGLITKMLKPILKPKNDSTSQLKTLRVVYFHEKYLPS
jgi:hypothetical protein